MSAHAHGPPSELVFEPPDYPLHWRAVAVTAHLRRLSNAALGQRLALQLRLFLRNPPRVVVDQWQVPQLEAAGPDFVRIVGAVHQLVRALHLPAVNCASRIARWLSCSESGVSRQLAGSPPAIVSMCNSDRSPDALSHCAPRLCRRPSADRPAALPASSTLAKAGGGRAGSAQSAGVWGAL